MIYFSITVFEVKWFLKCCCTSSQVSCNCNYLKTNPLKTLDTFGNCHRPVFSHGVSQHMHKIKKAVLSHEVVCFQMLDFRCLISRPHAWGLEINSIILLRNISFLKNLVISEGAISHNVLYYQQLAVAHYKVNFYANTYFE